MLSNIIVIIIMILIIIIIIIGVRNSCVDLLEGIVPKSAMHQTSMIPLDHVSLHGWEIYVPFFFWRAAKES